MMARISPRGRCDRSTHRVDPLLEKERKNSDEVSTPTVLGAMSTASSRLNISSEGTAQDINVL